MTLAQANALRMPLADRSVHMACFSPPYWALRDYGITGQLGLEPTPDAYIAAMMDVMAEVWRVLRDDGTCWVNLGDSYIAGKGQSGHADPEYQAARQDESFNSPAAHVGGRGKVRPQDRRDLGIAPKNLALMPFRFALAVQQQGWIVRQDIIWSKSNPMPESVKDRPTTAHEHVFLLAKQQRYYYDADAVREPHIHASDPRNDGRRHEYAPGSKNAELRQYVSHRINNVSFHPSGRNKRSVWTIATQSYSGAHFATWPEKLVMPMILAGTSEKGVCPEPGCGKQWERVVERVVPPDGLWTETRWDGSARDKQRAWVSSGKPRGSGQRYQNWLNDNPPITTGWQPTCNHDSEPVPATVLDPFVGSGTTVKVAREHGRRAIGLDLSLTYLRMAQKRNQQLTLWEAKKPAATVKERINPYNPSDLDGCRVEFLISFPQEPKGSLGTVVGKRVDRYAIQVDGTPKHCKTMLARDQFRLIDRAEFPQPVGQTERAS